ncbi:MAG: diaminopimelate epimerase [Planctomycetota bacterium]
MTRARFVSGAGNRFLVVDAWDTPLDGASLARRLGDAADGVLTITSAPSAAFRMVVHNRDGSRARMCGNGLRCAALATRLWGRTSGSELDVETDAGRLDVRWLDADLIECEVGRPRFTAREVPALGAPRLALTGLTRSLLAEPVAYALAVGGPHLVLFVPDVAAVELESIGPLLERHPRFPDRANVHFAERVNDGYRLRTWERGAGATRACGTGAAAVVVAGADLAPAHAAVESAGGTLAVCWAGGDEPVRVAGPAWDEGPAHSFAMTHTA